MKKISLRLNEQLARELFAYASSKNLSLSQAMRSLLLSGLSMDEQQKQTSLMSHLIEKVATSTMTHHFLAQKLWCRTGAITGISDPVVTACENKARAQIRELKENITLQTSLKGGEL